MSSSSSDKGGKSISMPARLGTTCCSLSDSVCEKLFSNQSLSCSSMTGCIAILALIDSSETQYPYWFSLLSMSRRGTKTASSALIESGVILSELEAVRLVIGVSALLGSVDTSQVISSGLEVGAYVFSGWSQKLILSPFKFSIDPDNPEDRNFNYTW